jgi:hypothetical protein
MTDAEIIRTIAEKVMGWMPVHERYAPHCGCSMVYDQREETLGKRFIGPACGVTLHVEHDRWNPLTSISDAFMVVEKMREFGWAFCLGEGAECWEVGFARGYQEAEGDALTIPRAICLAAIAAIAEHSTPEEKR